MWEMRNDLEKSDQLSFPLFVTQKGNIQQIKRWDGHNIKKRILLDRLCNINPLETAGKAAWEFTAWTPFPLFVPALQALEVPRAGSWVTPHPWLKH